MIKILKKYLSFLLKDLEFFSLKCKISILEFQIKLYIVLKTQNT